MNHPLRWGVIGLGRAGLAKLKAIDELGSEQAQLVAVASRRPLPLELTARYPKLKCMAWSDLVALDEVDAIAICSENELHEMQTKEALTHGKHTLVDFPLCSNAQTMCELIELASVKRVILHQELIGLLAPSHLLMLEQLSDQDPVAQVKIHFQGNYQGWVAQESQKGHWAQLALARLQRAWSLAGPLVLQNQKLTLLEQGYRLDLQLRGQHNAEVLLHETRQKDLKRNTQIEVYSQSGIALHQVTSHVSPLVTPSLFAQDLICFQNQVKQNNAQNNAENQNNALPNTHYIPINDQIAVMELIDELMIHLTQAL